jgi:hypothetical protein
MKMLVRAVNVLLPSRVPGLTNRPTIQSLSASFQHAKENFGMGGDFFLFNKDAPTDGQKSLCTLIKTVVAAYKGPEDCHSLWKDGSPDVNKLLVFSHLMRRALAALAFEIYVSTGVPPLNSSMACHTFCKESHSLWLYGTHTMLGFGSTKAGGCFGFNHHSDMRALAASSGITALVLLSIPRMAPAKVLITLKDSPEQHWHVDLISKLETINCNIFTDLRKGRRDSQEFAKGLKDFSA